MMDVFDRWTPHWKHELKPIRRFAEWPFLWSSEAMPAVDVVEKDEAIEVMAELPGLTEKDFTVELCGGQLILSGEKKSEHEEEDGGYYYSECSYGSFQRAVELPCEVDGDKVHAQYKHGVLTVTLPKTESAQTKRVPVDVS